MSIVEKLKREELVSLNGQLNYVNEALEANLENWERKEYEQVKSELILDIENLENHIKNIF